MNIHYFGMEQKQNLRRYCHRQQPDLYYNGTFLYNSKLNIYNRLAKYKLFRAKETSSTFMPENRRRR